MKRTKRLLSTLLALCMVLAMLPATAMAAAPETPVDRYTVLVLDHSGSMRGSPISALKEAAKNFCNQVATDQTRTNHVALVGFSTDAKVEHGFTSTMSDLTSTIDSFYADGLTNIGDGFRKAVGLLNNRDVVPENAVKNIILLSDGLPETNEKTADGPYTSADYPDYYFYGSANYASNIVVKELGLKNPETTINTYTIGFFHSMSAGRREFCKKVLADFANMSSYHVYNSTDLKFVLGDVISEEILGQTTEPDAPGNYDYTSKNRVVVTIACPVDVTVRRLKTGEEILNSQTGKLESAYGTITNGDVDSVTNTHAKVLTLHPDFRYSVEVKAADNAPASFNVAVSAVKVENGISSSIHPVESVLMSDSQILPLYVRPGAEDPIKVIPVAENDGDDAEDVPNHFTYVPTVTGGTVVLSKRNAEPGDWVNVYVTPDEGYKLESLTVTDMRGWPVTLREMGENAFSFTMPNARINVNPVFVKVEADDDPYSTNVPTNIPNIEGTSPNYGNMVINTAAMNYSDVNAGDWFYNNVKFCHERYLLNKTGEADGKFEPNTASTRATVWTALSRLAGRNTVTQGDNWYDRAQIWAKGKGITDGERPMDSMTREEFVTMLWRYDGNKYVQNSALGQFNDGESVSWWATEAVKWAVATGLLNGSNGSLNPQSNVTRAEVAAVLQRYVQNVH